MRGVGLVFTTRPGWYSPAPAAASDAANSSARCGLSSPSAAGRDGTGVTKHGEPVVELVRCARRGGIEFDKLEADRRRLGIEDASPEEAEAMIAAFHSPALSRRVLGLGNEK